MIDSRLIRADATKLRELEKVMKEQENSEILCSIDMKDICISSGAVEGICDAVASLTEGKKVLLVTGPVDFRDSADRSVKQRVYELLKTKYEVEWFVVREPDDSIVHCTPENAAAVAEHFAGVDCVVGIGGGTICDLCKYSTYTADHEHPLPLIIVQSALSVNAFSDNSSVMLFSGVKRTVHSRYPDILIISAATATLSQHGRRPLTGISAPFSA